MPAHRASDLPRYLSALETHILRRSKGPFVLGERITYADILIFQILHDEGFEVVQDSPALKRLVDAVKARPNVAKYLQSERYYG